MANSGVIRFRVPVDLEARLDATVLALQEAGNDGVSKSSVARIALQKGLGTPDSEIIASEVLVALCHQAQRATGYALEAVIKLIPQYVDRADED